MNPMDKTKAETTASETRDTPDQLAFVLFGLVGILETHKKTLIDAGEFLSAYPQLAVPENLPKSIQNRLKYNKSYHADVMGDLEKKAWEKIDDALTEVEAGLGATLETVRGVQEATKRMGKKSE